MRVAFNYNNYHLVWPCRERWASRGHGSAKLFNCKFAREILHASRRMVDASMVIKQHGILIKFALKIKCNNTVSWLCTATHMFVDLLYYLVIPYIFNFRWIVGLASLKPSGPLFLYNVHNFVACGKPIKRFRDINARLLMEKSRYTRTEVAYRAEGRNAAVREEEKIHEIHYLAGGGSRLVLIQRASQQLVGNLRV